MIIYIPIKHNSQRVHRKNFRVFNGEPLYKHTLLKYSNHRVFVDTDSQEIFDGIRNDNRLSHTKVYKRCDDRIGDNISVCLLLERFIEKFNIDEPFAQIHVTSPFLKETTLVNAYSKLHEGYDSIVSCNIHQSRFWRKENYGMCPINHNPVKLEQTQDLSAIYEENSCFYIMEPNIIYFGNRIGRNPLFYPINKIESIDIDTEEDWGYATQISRTYN